MSSVVVSQKDKKKDVKKNDDGPRDEDKKGKVKIEEINTVTIDSIEILFMSCLLGKALTTSEMDILRIGS